MENNETIQYVDTKVTNVKFERELQEFKQNETEYRKKGIICLKLDPPSIYLLFAVPHIKPQPIAFAVHIDYTNWDVEPPSITFIDPFTEKILQREEIYIKLFQINDMNAINVMPDGRLAGVDLLQGGNGISPFLCIPGVREYHKHPAHSGDSWMLYRTRGEGKLCALIDQLYSHSIAQTSSYSLSISINITGLNLDINKLKA